MKDRKGGREGNEVGTSALFDSGRYDAVSLVNDRDNADAEEPQSNISYEEPPE